MTTANSYNDLEKTKEQIDFIKHKLMYDERWLLKALTTLYSLQTNEEQYNKETKELNGVGFNGVDSRILTELAQQYIEKEWLSEKQIKVCRKLLPKYSRQLNSIAQSKRRN